MDLFPLLNSLRIAGISTVIIFFAGIFSAYYIAKAPRAVKGVLDVVLTLPRTATISTTVYQLWRTNDDAGAFRWVLVNLAISAVVLLAVNMLEKRQRQLGLPRKAGT